LQAAAALGEADPAVVWEDDVLKLSEEDIV